MKQAGLKRYEIANGIRDYVAQGDLAPGARLPSEHEFAAMFKTSRPSVREALVVLHLSGEIDIKPGSASYVRSPTKLCCVFSSGMGPMEILKARMAIESKLAAEAAVLATDEDLTQLRRLLDDMQEEESRSMHQSLSRAFHLLLASVARQPVVGEIVGLLIEEMSSKHLDRRDESNMHSNLETETKEHLTIFSAIVKRDARVAATAMRAHLQGVEERLKHSDEPHRPASHNSGFMHDAVMPNLHGNALRDRLIGSRN